MAEMAASGPLALGCGWFQSVEMSRRRMLEPKCKDRSNAMCAPFIASLLVCNCSCRIVTGEPFSG